MAVERPIPRRELDQTYYETAVGLIEVPMLRLAGQLRERFERGHYQLLIGDDVSGRFPTLALWEYAKRLAEKHNMPSPIACHISKGSADSENMQFSDLLETIETRHITSTLIVTEYINDGLTLHEIERRLAGTEVAADIATIEHLNGGFSHKGILYSGRGEGPENFVLHVIELRRFTKDLCGILPDGRLVFPDLEDEQKKAQFQAGLRDANRLAVRMLSAQ